jgi:hypothetical protein
VVEIAQNWGVVSNPGTVPCCSANGHFEIIRYSDKNEIFSGRQYSPTPNIGDSSGYIIVGENKVVGKVINSTGYELKLVELLKKARQKINPSF